MKNTFLNATKKPAASILTSLIVGGALKTILAATGAVTPENSAQVGIIAGILTLGTCLATPVFNPKENNGPKTPQV